MGWNPPNKRRYTTPLVRTKEDAKYIHLMIINDKEVDNTLTKEQIWERIIMDTKAVFIFDMETTKCYIYTVEYYEAHPELKVRFSND